MKRLIWIGCLSYLLIGIAHVVIGSVLTVMLNHYDRDYSNGGLLISAQFAGFLVGVLGTPWMSRRSTRRHVLTLAFASLFVAETVYTFLPPWYAVVAIAPLAGFGFGMIEAIVGALIIEAAKDKKAVEMSKLEVCFGLGALLMPLMAGAFIYMELWNVSFATIAVFSLVMAVLAWRLPFGGEADELLDHRAAASGASAGRVYKTRSQLFILGLFIALFLLYVGLEMSLVNFLPSLMIEQYDVADATATFSVSMFWITMVIGRMFIGVIAEKISYIRFILIAAFGTFFSFALLALANGITLAYAAVLLLGLFMSGMFAIFLIYANQLLPNTTEHTTSMLIAAGGIGGALLPLMTGWSMDMLHVSGTMLLLLVLSALMLTGSLLSSRRGLRALRLEA